MVSVIYNRGGGNLTLTAYDMTIPDGDSSVSISHGLVGTPVLERFLINDSIDNRGYRPRIINIGATTFTLDLDGDIADGDVTFKVSYLGTC